jgi:hypothetical protein
MECSFLPIIMLEMREEKEMNILKYLSKENIRVVDLKSYLNFK